MIYFIQNTSNFRIKIGYSDKPKKRLSMLQVGNDTKLNLIKTIEGDKRLEKKLHRIFKESKHRGEWFFMGENLITYLTTNRLEGDESSLFEELEWCKSEVKKLKGKYNVYLFTLIRQIASRYDILTRSVCFLNEIEKSFGDHICEFWKECQQDYCTEYGH